MSDLLNELPACAGCGKCCHLLVDVAPTDDVPEDLVVEHAGMRCMDQHGDGACVALDPLMKLCTIYERRPQVCRDFQRGSGLCRQILISWDRDPRSHRPQQRPGAVAVPGSDQNP